MSKTSAHPYKYTHKQALVPFFGRLISVDEGLVEVLSLIWKFGIKTCNSCQENFKGIVWIQFLSPQDVIRFLNLVAEHPIDNLKPWKTMYARMTQFQIKKEWKYDLNIDDNGNHQVYDEETCYDNYTGTPDITFQVSVRFPRSDLKEIVQKLKDKVCKNEDRSLEASSCQ